MRITWACENILWIRLKFRFLVGFCVFCVFLFIFSGRLRWLKSMQVQTFIVDILSLKKVLVFSLERLRSGSSYRSRNDANFGDTPTAKLHSKRFPMFQSSICCLFFSFSYSVRFFFVNSSNYDYDQFFFYFSLFLFNFVQLRFGNAVATVPFTPRLSSPVSR